MKCFVVMPYGRKRDHDKRWIDFDVIYRTIIKSAVERCDIECVLSSEITRSGPIHRDMFEHLVSDEFVIADLTTLNPNVLYELGVRHLAKRSVTIVMARKGVVIPFNIAGHRTLEYDPFDKRRYPEVSRRLEAFIKDSRDNFGASDSPIYDSLNDVQLRRTSPPIATPVVHQATLRSAPDRSIRIFGGDIKHAQNIAQVWVNPENTSMQMARPYDRAISASIRFRGATKDENDQIVEDIIAEALAARMKERGRLLVEPGTVITTTSGELKATHGVEAIFHVAAVQGSVGQGYVPVHDLDSCAERVFRHFETFAKDAGDARAMLFPLMGAGTGQGAVERSSLTVARAAITALSRPEARLKTLYMLAFTEDELRTCLQTLSGLPELAKPVPAPIGASA